MPEEDVDKDFKNPLYQYTDERGGIFYYDKFAKFIRKNFVLPFRKEERPVYYHRKFERVPTIDQCEIGDPLCRFEANQQFLRDKKVDIFKLKILRRRWTECNYYWGDSKTEMCQKEKNDYENSCVNYHLRYGEVGRDRDVLENYMKQKHRMIFARRKQAEGVDFQYTD